MYDAGIAFNAVNYDSFGPAIEAVGQYGPGMKPPSYHEVRVPCLKDEVQHTKVILKEHEEQKVKYGCTLMVDGWRDRKGRSLFNFLVNTPKGSMFVESVDASEYSHTGEKMLQLFDKFVQEVGEQHVVQVVSDSAAPNVWAGKKLEEKYPHIYWSPCAAHCLDLMFEDIFNMPDLKRTLERAVMVNGYIYNRTQVLNMLRDFTKQRDMIRPAKTRFATAFLTLRSFQLQKQNLKNMFSSERWTKSKFAKERAGKQVANVIFMSSFWNTIKYAMKVGAPLVNVLRLVDGEKRPAMGYIYEAMNRAKEQIEAAFSKVEDRYKDVFEIIDKRWDVQLHRPLHAAGYFLNPEFYYNNPEIEQDEEVMSGLYDSISKLVRDSTIEDDIHKELIIYKRGDGIFGKPAAKRARTLISPAEWWGLYGASAPNLQKLAIKILSLTCISSGCERNWSVFKHLHSKKRNRLEQKRLSDLVFIKYNRALRRRYNQRDTIDPISLDRNGIEDDNEWIIGVMENEEDAPVFDDDDGLRWGHVETAMGVNEAPYSLRGSRASQSKVGASQSKVGSIGSSTYSRRAAKNKETSFTATSTSQSRAAVRNEEDEPDFDFDQESGDEDENDVELYKDNNDDGLDLELGSDDD